MELGIDSFAARFDDAGLAARLVDRMRELLERIEHADQVGLDVFGVGEHHKREFLDSAPPVILAAAAARTRRIRLTSAVAVLSAADPGHRCPGAARHRSCGASREPRRTGAEIELAATYLSTRRRTDACRTSNLRTHASGALIAIAAAPGVDSGAPRRARVGTSATGRRACNV
jgi:hypothetical protein